MVSKEIITPIGLITIAASDLGIRAISFGGRQNLTPEFSKTTPILCQCEQELEEYFRGVRKHFSVPLDLRGTEFQLKVWDELQKIKYGTTVSYAEQAERMGRKSSVRAVAAANGKNPIAIVVPCHRVIASSGRLHGYAGGLDIKRRLLGVEGVVARD